ncbi:substrate-binding domain-containing protein [Nocardioides sp. TRM66260-LWL]|uniref:substrate-binding domain-containing protein n=1 Tax=Nocardioides sp. TRM66260-LWL TaxID=2874478 RepID=UPI001CC41DE9|nr:substrate-binding domain-containing protein [Nocardioides sp. TRM66260-LWL]MBZ5734724.1 substrate-binding domain-containing protein [Nocardioides sp. TRM66260-LWL]
MKRLHRVAMLACGLGLATAALGTSIAVADPSGDPAGTVRPLQGMGSDTTEEVMQGLSDVITDSNGNKLIASWNSTGAGFTTRSSTTSSSGCSFTAYNAGDTWVLGKRANNSGNGAATLRAAVTSNSPYAGCVDFARASSSQTGLDANNKFVNIPFAKDAVAFAVTSTSNFPRKLTGDSLYAIYHCTYGGATPADWNRAAGTGPYHALVPAPGSGTRSFWLKAMGISTDGTFDATAYPCISDSQDRVSANKAPLIQEHRGNVLDDDSIVPISIAQYIAQAQGTSTDYRGDALLGTVASTGGVVSYPISLNTGYANNRGTKILDLTRDVYNVVPQNAITSSNAAFNQTLSDVFVGPNSKVCQAQSTILKYGFGVLSTCGDTSLVK